MKLGKLFLSKLFLVMVLLIVVTTLAVSSMVTAQAPSSTATPMATTTATPYPTASSTAAQTVSFGQVVSIAADKSSFVIQWDSQTPVTVNVTTATTFYVITIDPALMSSLMGELNSLIGMMGSGYMMGPGDGMNGMGSGRQPAPGMSVTPYASSTTSPRASSTTAPRASSTTTPYASSTPDINDLMNQMVQMGTINDVAVGDLVITASSTRDGSDAQVAIIKFAGNLKFVQGKVTAASASSVTVASAASTNVTLGWDANSWVLLNGAASMQVGLNVFALYDTTTMAIKVALVMPTAALTPSGSPVPSASAAASPAVSPVVSPSVSASPAVSPAISPSASVSAFTVNTMTKPGIGTYLVDSKGMTLYFTMKDSVGKSVVTGATLQTWPVFNAPTVTVPASLKATDFGTITRTDGSMQTTFRGYPLYYFANDKAPGDTNGQGIGGVWFAVTPSNFPPAASASPSATP